MEGENMRGREEIKLIALWALKDNFWPIHFIHAA
jgi:hypothetical protein